MMPRDDNKYEQVNVLFLPEEKRAAEEMATALYGAKYTLARFIRAAVLDYVASTRASIAICEAHRNKK